jgi:hypothetical protein
MAILVHLRGLNGINGRAVHNGQGNGKDIKKVIA